MRPLFLAGCSLLLGLDATAQAPPGAALPKDLATLAATPPPGSPADQRWQVARQNLANGQLDAARAALLDALGFHAASPALLFDMLLACRGDEAHQLLWLERWVRAASNAQGQSKLDANQRKQLAAHKHLDKPLAATQKLQAQRAAALAAAAGLAARYKPSKGAEHAERAILARWAAELALTVGDGAPAMLAASSPSIAAAVRAFAVDHAAVVDGLVALLAGSSTTGSASGGPDARALAAARVLLGLRRQQLMPDVYGPFPADPKLLERAAAAAQATQERAVQARAGQRAWTIAELEALTADEIAAFTREHADWSRPGIALSPTSRYRIETICGHETLLGVARTVELHHQRLVSHYGVDPFLTRQGVVRIVPEHTDMETDGSPHWWAGGFQGGDLTTIRFAWGNLPGLGRTLTHELTHRFDGVLRPFLPSWYGEGHADWTAKHYARAADPEFAEDHLDLHTVARVHGMGYGDRARLVEMLTGKVEEYRDNYPVGYALYAFLRGHCPPGTPPYRTALAAYERNARAGGSDPLAYFTSVFCDGKDGRAATFDAFVGSWQTFLRESAEWLGGRRKDLEWPKAYRTDLGPGDPAPMVLDEPTWSWAKVRSEPFFGHGHAAAAAALLTAAGDRSGALAAGLWSLDVDGWRERTAKDLAVLLQQSKDPHVAGAFAALARQRFPSLPEVPIATAALAPVAAFGDALRARADALRASGAELAAAELGQQAARIAARFGKTEPPAADVVPPPALPTHLASFGLQESELLGYDEHRVAGLWHLSADGDLHVGRDQPRTGTGSFDRDVPVRDAFVHSVAWHGPGAYTVRGRVHFTTSYVEGAVVLGHQRRDRNVLLSFTARDFDPETRGGAQRGVVDLQLSAGWERDGNLPGSQGAAQVDLADGQSWFDFTLVVRGPAVQVAIAGEHLCSYTWPDGAPLEGQLGFAVRRGTIRVQQALVQRLDERTSVGLDLNGCRAETLDELLGLPVRGLPRAPHGTVVLWLPRSDTPAPVDNLPRALPQVAKLLRDTREHPQQVVVVLPQELPAATQDLVQGQFEAERGGSLPRLLHDVGAPLVGHFPFVLFVDAGGVLRAGAEIGEMALHSRVTRWARLFRGR